MQQYASFLVILRHEYLIYGEIRIICGKRVGFTLEQLYNLQPSRTRILHHATQTDTALSAIIYIKPYRPFAHVIVIDTLFLYCDRTGEDVNGDEIQNKRPHDCSTIHKHE